MRARRIVSPTTLSVLMGIALITTVPASAADEMFPKVPAGWSVSLVAKAPEILFPTAIVAAPDGTVYLGQDPMDMPGPPTVPIDSVVAIKDGTVRVFADKLWAVMGLEWADDTLYVVHAPFLSAFRDTDGDGKADRRIDLMTGLGPKLPGFSGINDHVASGVRLGIDGYLYIAVGDKGIPKGVGKDGTTIQLFGGGVIRIRPDGTGLEVVSTGERNPLSVALSATDEIFTYGNDDDSKKWPNSLTHHIVGAHYGYPYQFLTAPFRTLPIMDGQVGGSGTQGICYNEDGLPQSYRGNLFFCDWGLQTVFRYAIEPSGGTFRVKSKTAFVTKGDLSDFRPFSLAVSNDPRSLYLVDWAFAGWLADGPKTGRLFRLAYTGDDRPTLGPRPTGIDAAALIGALDHPALSVRRDAQVMLAKKGAGALPALSKRLAETSPETGRIHAIWTLDAINTPEARKAIRGALIDSSPVIRLQAARSAGNRSDKAALPALTSLLKDRNSMVRREAAIALGKLGDPAATPRLMADLGDSDVFVSWAIRHAIRALNAWDGESLVWALTDPKRREDALKLCDETWSPVVVNALVQAYSKTTESEQRSKQIATLAGLYRKYPAWSGAWFGTNPLAGTLPQKTEPWDVASMARVQVGLAEALKDPAPEVRLRAIGGLFPVGRPALNALRASLTTEKEPRNLSAIAAALGALGDFPAAPALGAIVLDATKPEEVRIVALDALGNLRGPQALTARISLVYDPKAPASLVARALPPLGKEGIIPPNDLASFLDHADPSVRSAALRALTPKKGKSLPAEVNAAVLAKFDDKDTNVRKAAMESSVALNLRQAVPKLLVAAMKDETRSDATLALAAMPDATALPVYLAALRDRSPEVRRAGESALLTLRDKVRLDLESAAKSGKFEGPAALALERILTKFVPITQWKVIGPFARTTAPVFVGERSIDFGKTHSGAEGRTISWADRKSDPLTGRIVLDDFKGGVGDRGGFGYDTNGSPDLSSFGYTQIVAENDRDALLLIGSSGSLIVNLNEQRIHTYDNFAGRAYSPDSDLVPISLKKGSNRLLMRARQGIGSWSFSVQVSESSNLSLASRASRPAGIEGLRAFALKREGDPRNGEALFFDAKGIGCVKCHSVSGKGTATIGPDLAGLSLKYDKTEIIRSVLEPSARIATGYQPVVIATRDGRVINGLIRTETDDFVELVDGETKLTRVAKTDIEERKVGDVSVMPAGQVDSLKPLEFADLISYLTSLKAAAGPAH